MLVPEDRQVDVRFTDVGADWRKEFRRIYKMLGLPFDDPAERSMTDWLANNHQEPGAAYDTGVEEFGVDQADLADKVADYCTAHGVRAEGKGTR